MDVNFQLYVVVVVVPKTCKSQSSSITMSEGDVVMGEVILIPKEICQRKHWRSDKKTNKTNKPLSEVTHEMDELNGLSSPSVITRKRNEYWVKAARSSARYPHSEPL